MSVARAFMIIIGAAFGCGVIGAGLGAWLGRVIPDYYRGVFRAGNNPNFDPIHVGIGLGATQGIVAGLVVGCVVVLSVSIFKRRMRDDT